MNIFWHSIFHKDICIGLYSGFGQKTKKIKTKKWTSQKRHCMHQNHPPILLNHEFYQNIMKRSRQVKSLKFIDICSNKNTYKYIVFSSYIFWKPEKLMKVHIIQTIEISVYFVWWTWKQ